MGEVIPKSLGVEEFEFFLRITGQFAQAPIVKQEPSFFVDDADHSRAIVENLTELALLFGDLHLVLRQCGDVINPEDALPADKTDVSSVIGDLDVRQQEMNEAARLGSSYHPLIQNLSAPAAQLVDDPGALVEVMPMQASVAKIEFLLRISQDFTQAAL